MLLGRDEEQQAIEHALGSARSGLSATLAFVGEPGIGKTALLDHAERRAAGMRVLRARGVESEAEVPFGSLLELVRPALGVLESIPEPQAIALESALALRPAQAQDRFAVGAATLSLLAAYAEENPLAVLLDDAHWLDASSAHALRFAFRRFVADPIAVIICVREGEPSLLDGADLTTLRLHGLSSGEASALLPELPTDVANRLNEATGGNPLALLELGREVDRLELARIGAPVLVPDRIARAFLERFQSLPPEAARSLVLAAASDTPDVATLSRAAARLGLDLMSLDAAERIGLLTRHGAEIEFRHPLARSAIYAQAPPEERRAAHRALASSLPDRDLERRAWHLAAASPGPDDAASAALEQAAVRSRDRSAYATAAAAFDRASRLAADTERQARLLWEAAEAAWLSGLAERATQLLAEARVLSLDPALSIRIDHLSGRIAIRQGPVMTGIAVLVSAARQADPETAVLMLAEAAIACMIAGDTSEMVRTAAAVTDALPEGASPGTRYLALLTAGMVSILSGDAHAGMQRVREAVGLAEASGAVRTDERLLPWLVLGPVFLRERRTGRALIDQALDQARAKSAIGALPYFLNLVARDDANTTRWAVAEATHIEAIQLARETGQLTDVAFGLADLAILQARSGRESECRRLADEGMTVCRRLGLGLYELWITAALGELELGLGRASFAAEHFEHQQELLLKRGITDVDLSPAADLVESYLRLGRRGEAARTAATFAEAAEAKGQPWSLARSLRAQGLLASDHEAPGLFEQALARHEETPDVFQSARTHLAYGECLRRARRRVRSREHLRLALEQFEKLGADPWSERARTELAASGEHLRRRDPTTLDELTPQELNIALLLAEGRTTKEAAAALFLSPKTIEYHLRHVYVKLGISSREALAQELAKHTDSGALAATPAP